MDADLRIFVQKYDRTVQQHIISASIVASIHFVSTQQGVSTTFETNDERVGLDATGSGPPQ